MEKISITRALNQLKLLDKRILKGIQSGEFVTLKIGGINQRDNVDSSAEFQSVTDLIDYRSILKSKIMVSNSRTRVKIGAEELTVVEAIEKKSSIEYKKQLLRQLSRNLQKTRNDVEMHNAEQVERLDRLLQANFSKDLKARGLEFDEITKRFWDSNKAEFNDTSDIEDTIIKLSDEIDTFENEVDLVLSESNAITSIEV